MTLVAAPAGYGKTTLISEWVVGSGLPFAWLSLDETENDLARFLTYLVAALQTVDESIGHGITTLLQSPQRPPPASLMMTLINQINSLSPEFILVLDDYHLITAQQIHDALTYLVNHQPDNIHLVLVTRADPPLPIARLRGRGQLTELRLSDLRFTPSEASTFLNTVMSLELEASDIDTLAARTEGWIAGLQMASLSIRQREDPAGFIAAFAGSNRYVVDYLWEEVLRHEPDHVQDFLLQTSILDRLSAPICAAILDSESFTELSSQEILEYLERTNLFVVSLDDHREWYRYHRLFIDLLRIRLRLVQSKLVPALHRRASRWYGQRGDISTAIKHSLAAEDYEQAAQLIDQAAEETLMRGETATLLSWVEALPDEAVRERPSLCVFHAWTLLMTGGPLEAAESRLERAERNADRVPGRVVALRAFIAALQDRMGESIDLAKQALSELPQEDLFLRSYAIWILGAYDFYDSEFEADSHSLEDVARVGLETGNLMIAVTALSQLAELKARQGQLHSAWDVFQQTLKIATDERGQLLPIAGGALMGLGDLAREWNDLDAATKYLLESIRLIEQWSEVGSLEAYLSLARVRVAQTDLVGAQEAVNKATQLAVQFDATEIDDLVVELYQAYLWIVQGDFDAVERWAAKRELVGADAVLEVELPTSMESRMRKYECLALARTWIAQGRLEDALTLLDSLAPLAERRERPALAIEIQALKALARQAQGDTYAAVAELERALKIGEPEGYVRIFLDQGPAMVQLLKETASRGVSVGYAERLLAAAEQGSSKLPVPSSPQVTPLKPKSPKPGDQLVEPLSQRESEVLQLLATSLSSSEIADELSVAVSTVRSHTKSIYSKLNVRRRLEAVERARELGLL
jgi:LuxR family maltose regulon positive regulatory protein